MKHEREKEMRTLTYFFGVLLLLTFLSLAHLNEALHVKILVIDDVGFAVGCFFSLFSFLSFVLKYINKFRSQREEGLDRIFYDDEETTTLCCFFWGLYSCQNIWKRTTKTHSKLESTSRWWKWFEEGRSHSKNGNWPIL